MIKYLLCFSLPLFFILLCCSSNTVDINIELIADNLHEVTNIYITGNNNQLGDWQLYEVELNEIEKGRGQKIFTWQE